MKVSVSVVNGKTIIDAKDLCAIEGGQYVLFEGRQGVGPENIALLQVGKHLYIALEGTSLEASVLTIEDFYDYEGKLIGMTEDSTYYEYTAVGGDEDRVVALRLDGTFSLQA